MPRRLGRRPAIGDEGGAEATTTTAEQLSMTAWGLDPAQWRQVGSFTAVRHKAVLLWCRGDGAPPGEVALRARRAYDRMWELGITLAADETERGIEVTVPLSRMGLVLRSLGEWAILPDAVLVTNVPADELRRLQRELAASGDRVSLEIGTHEEADPVAQLRARVRLG